MLGSRLQKTHLISELGENTAFSFLPFLSLFQRHLARGISNDLSLAAVKHVISVFAPSLRESYAGNIHNYMHACINRLYKSDWPGLASRQMSCHIYHVAPSRIPRPGGRLSRPTHPPYSYLSMRARFYSCEISPPTPFTFHPKDFHARSPSHIM